VDTFLLRLHQSQIAHQCRAALWALDLAEQSLNEGDGDRFWVSVQNALSAAANISKGLWGQSGTLTQEREPLRDSLGITGDSIFNTTTLRNHIDHYDERLDRWYENSQRKIFVGFNIGISVGGVDPTDMFLNSDANGNEVTFWNDCYSLADLRKSLETLLPVAAREADQSPW
jgi:hypothetical protein